MLTSAALRRWMLTPLRRPRPRPTLRPRPTWAIPRPWRPRRPRLRGLQGGRGMPWHGTLGALKKRAPFLGADGTDNYGGSTPIFGVWKLGCWDNFAEIWGYMHLEGNRLPCNTYSFIHILCICICICIYIYVVCVCVFVLSNTWWFDSVSDTACVCFWPVTLEQMKLQNWSLAYQAPEEAQVEGEPGEAIWLLNPEWFSAVFYLLETGVRSLPAGCVYPFRANRRRTTDSRRHRICCPELVMETWEGWLFFDRGKPIVGRVVAFVVWKRKTCWNYPAKCCTRWGTCYGCCRYRGAASSHAPNTSAATLL